MPLPRRWSHVIGFDDGAFDHEHRGDVLLVGAVFNGPRLEGVLTGKVRRDGANATDTIYKLITDSRFATHLQAVLTQGVAVAGFNVVDLPLLHQRLQIPVITVARRQPDFASIKRALLQNVPGGARKWRLIERLGKMQRIEGVYVQYIGIEREDVATLMQCFAINGRLPEPLRVAHMIGAGVSTGQSRHRP